MQNLTLLSLSILSLNSVSPLYTINQKASRVSISVLNSHFSRSFTNILYSNTRYQSTLISNNIFMNTLSTPLVFHEGDSSNYDGICRGGSKCCVSDKYNFQKNNAISGQNITETDFPTDFKSKHPFFENILCGNLTITKCNFIKCKEEKLEYGGGISISAYLEVILHHCIFDECNSLKHGCGGAIGASHSFDYGSNTPKFGNAQRLDVQYTCFSNCYPRENDIAFGTALLMAANDVILYYASTVNCPKDKTAYGAQFDIQASNSISSQFVNATGGKSKYCGSIEYRHSKSGFFRYQTLMKMECKYVTSFTSVDIDDIQIFSCNVNNNTVRSPSGGTDEYNKPALVFVRYKKLTVTNFFFFNNTFHDYALFTERENYGNTGNINITLIDCYADVDNSNLWDRYYIIRQNCEFKKPMAKTFALRQLQLGHCQGDIPPGPMIITPFFTASSQFSQSSHFTNSKPFTKTNEFTKSTDFTESNDFTASDAFTSSKAFTPSLNFNQTSYFTPSKSFTASNPFTKSSFFSESNDFTESNKFSASDAFTYSKQFSCSEEFSHSTEFSHSDEFSHSSLFTSSKGFTKSAEFSSSSHFSSSNDFTASNELVVNNGGNVDDNNKLGTGAIAGIVAGAVAASGLVAGLAVFFWFKTHPRFEANSANMMKETDSSVTVDNNLQTVMDQDDPFAADFMNNELSDLE